jgi:DNA polymerase-3 subunit delta'
MSRAPARTPRSRDIVEAPDESDRFENAPHPRENFELFGHEVAEQTLLTAFRAGRLPQSWIIGGREGIGKATLAWRFARFLLAYPDPRLPQVERAENLFVPPDHPASRRILALAHSDVAVLRREWDSDKKRHYTEIRVDDARQMMGRFQQAAAEGGWRIAIIDCAEDLNRNTANALLKLIEEPPPRSVFLFVSHRPAQILATIRSRSRLLPLSPLGAEDVEKAIRGLGGEWWEMEDGEVRSAAARGNGSVRDALRLLGGDSLKLMERIESLLQGLPEVDWKKVSQLSESVSKREATADFEAVVAAVFDWIDSRIRTGAGQGTKEPSQLAPYAEVWEKFARSVRETETYNLDRRALILSLFTDLATAVRRAA